MALRKFKKIMIVGTCTAIIIGSFAGCTSNNYGLHKSNPFNGNEISCSDFLTNLKVEKAIDNIFDETQDLNVNDMSDNELKAYLLYDAINNNQNLKEEEKQQFAFLIDEWKNNEYLDYETLYEQLKTLKIERNVNFKGTNILEQYDRKQNLIRLSAVDKEIYKTKEEQEKRHQQILSRTTHGGGHSTRTSEIKQGEEWLEEAYCSIVDAEATGSDWDYKLCTNTARFLCEILGREEGADVVRKARQKGDITILTSALNNKGIPESMCMELYEIEETYKELTGELSSNEVKEKRLDLSNKAANLLAQMYDISNSYPEKETYTIRILLSCIRNDTKLDLSKYKFYYFNSEKKELYPGFVMEDGNYIIYYEDYKMYEYKINELNEEILVTAGSISDRNALDQALNYSNIKERN